MPYTRRLYNLPQGGGEKEWKGGSEGIYADQPFMTTGVVIYFFFRRRELKEIERGEEWRERRTGDARDISNFLIIPRGANDLPLAHPSLDLSLSLPFSPPPFRLSRSILPFVLSNANPSRHRYNVASFHPPQSPPHSPPLQSHTNQPSE